MGRFPGKGGIPLALLTAWTGFVVFLWCWPLLAEAQTWSSCPELPQLNLTRNGSKLIAAGVDSVPSTEITCICSPVYYDEQVTGSAVNCSNATFREAKCTTLPTGTSNATEVAIDSRVLSGNASVCLFSECGRNNCNIFDELDQIVNISASLNGLDGLRILWTRPSGYSDTNDHDKIRYCVGDDKAGCPLEKQKQHDYLDGCLSLGNDTAKKEGSYDFSSLKPGSFVVVGVRTTRRYPSGAQRSSSETIGCFKAFVPGDVTNITVEAIGSRNVSLKWNLEQETDQQLQPSSYNVSWCVFDGTTDCATNECQEDEGNTTITSVSAVNISDLTPWSVVSVKVSPLYLNGSEEVSGFGAYNSTCFTTLVEAPEKVEQLKVITAEATTATVEWKKPRTANGPLDGYILKWCRAEDYVGSGCTQDKTRETTINSSSNTGHTLNLLDPWTEYRVTVAAFNVDKDGSKMTSAEEVVVVKTDAAAPGDVTELSAVDITNESLSLTWRKPHTTGGHLDHYEITYCVTEDCTKTPVTSGNVNWNSSGCETVNETREVAQLVGLSPWTWIAVRVIAVGVTKNNTKLFSGATTICNRTKIGAPEEVQDFRVITVEATTVTIKWKEPKTKNGPLDGYLFTWCRVNDSTGSVCEEDTKENTTVKSSSLIIDHVQAGLDPWAKYRVTVVAFNRDEDGSALTSPEAAKVIETDAAAPEAVTSLSVVKITKDSLSVTWKAPSVTGGNLDHYETTYCETDNCNMTSSPIDNEIWSSSRCLTANGTNQYARLIDLHPWTLVAVQVTAVGKTRNGTELLGESATDCKRTKMGEPGMPEDLTVKAETDTLHISWNPPAVPNGEIAKYIMHICRAGLGNCKEMELPSRETTTVVKDLMPWSAYNISVAARNIEDGAILEGIPATTTVRTLPAAASMPLSLTESEENHTIKVSWAEPENPRGPLNGYNVSWDARDWLGRTTEMDSLNTSDLEASIPAWKAYSNYTVTVRAFHELDDGGRLYGDAASLDFRTAVGVPGEPVVLIMAGARSAAVLFRVPDFPNGPLDGFLWTNCATSPMNMNETATCTNRTDSREELLLLERLKPWTHYTFAVRAYNLGPEQTKLIGKQKSATYRTHQAEPSAVGNFSVAKAESRTLFVNWSEPAEKNGELPAYELSWRAFDGRELNHTEVTSRSVPVRFLEPYTKYVIEVLAFNKYREERLKGPPVRVIARTLPEAPGPVGNLRAQAFKNNTVILTWKRPSEPRGEVLEYVVIYNATQQGKPSKPTVEIEGNSLRSSSACNEWQCTFELRGLVAEYTYSFDVRGRNVNVSGLGDPVRSPETVLIPAGDPPPPKNVSLVTADCPSTPNPDTQKAFVLSRNIFEDTNGEIIYYEVVVGSADRIDEEVTTEIAWSELSRKQRTPPHVITPKRWNPFKVNGSNDPLNCRPLPGETDTLVCTIGAEQCDNYKAACNGALRGGTKYALYVIGYTQGGSRPTKPEVFITALPQETSSAGATVAGVLSAIVIMGAILVVFIVHRRRQARQKKPNPKRLSCNSSDINIPVVQFTPQCTINGAPSKPLPPVPPEAMIEMESHVLKDINRPIPKTEFKEHLKMMLKDSAYRFASEYERLVEFSPQYSSDVARHPANSKKNRFTNIHPFDKSRVPLSVVGEDEQTSYINASFVKGCNSEREYIAAQGPNALTTNDFWRMIWEHDVKIIIMLTQFVEANKKKCEKYWPEDNKEHAYGSVLVRKDSTTVLNDYTLTEFKIKSDDSSKWRSVRHVFFTAWKDHGVPEKPQTLVKFVRACQGMFGRRGATQPPVLVHCSAGVGRTGTFIALDICLQKLELEDDIDIFHLVLDLRECRRCMVQNELQYTYLYQCVAAVIDEMSGNPIQDEPLYENVRDLRSGLAC